MAEHPSPVADELAEARDLCALPDPVQLDLMRDAAPGRDPGTAVAVAERQGRRGRPPGALNKANRKFREQLLGMCGGQHPALVLARATNTPVEQLAAVLQCDRATAYGFQQRAAIELMPYLESQMPRLVAVKSQHDVVLVMAGGAGASGDLEAVAREIDEAQEAGVDWGSAEVVDVLPSLSGEPKEGGPSEPSA